MAKIFLSYARMEQTFAEQLRQALLSWGDQPWMDVHEIRTGEKWWDDIDQGLTSAEIVVGLLSELSLESVNVRNEWNWAMLAERRLVLMQLGKFDVSRLSHRFVGMQYIDYGRDASGGFSQLRAFLKGERTSGQTIDMALASNGTGEARSRRAGPEALNRERMIQRVRSYWIDGVLRQAVNESNRFNIGYGLAPDAVVQNVDFSDCALPAEADFGRVFRHVGAEILILGAPGSGKTILLLQLAEYLLDAAMKDAGQAIPIVLNLSSWSPRFTTLAEWIVEEAYLSYQVPRRAIQRWLEDGALIPLLDGLDEVLVENREGCVEAINAFRQDKRGVELAVCSRFADYNLLKSKLALRSAILLQPLDEKQVNAVITRPDLAGLKTFWEREPWLREMALVPFLLNVMSYAYAGCAETQLRLPASEAGEEPRRDHLLDTYVTRRLTDTRDRRVDSAQKIREQLGWLARRMQERGQSVFHFESLQKDWVGSLTGRMAFCYLGRMLFAAGLGVILLTLAVFLYLAVDKAAGSSVVEFTQAMIGIVYLGGMTAAVVEWGRTTCWEGPWKGFGRVIVMFLVSFLPLAALSNFSNPYAPGKPATMCFIFLSVALFVTFTKRLGTGPFVLYCAVTGLAWEGFCMLLFGGANLASRYAYALHAHHLYPKVLIYPETPSVRQMLLLSLYSLYMFPVLAMSVISLFGDSIVTAQAVQWRWRRRNLLFGMTTALVLFLVPVLSDYYSLKMAIDLYLKTRALHFHSGHAFDSRSDLSAETTKVLEQELGYVGGELIWAVGCGVFLAALLGFSRSSIVHKKGSPIEGIKRSLRTGAGFGVACGAAVYFAVYAFVLAETFLASYGPMHFLTYWGFSTPATAALDPALDAAAVGAILGGANVPASHYALRLVLLVESKLPLRLQRFLDGCTDCLLLRRVGGGYIFIHRYLLEYFAKTSKAAPAPAKS